MKKLNLYLCAIILLISSSLFSQNGTKSILLNEGFENGMPSSWNFYEYGNPGNQHFEINGYSYTGKKGVLHRANLNTSPDTWMVLPVQTISNSNFYLSFWEATHSFYYYNSHEILLSTGSGNPADGDFTHVLYTIAEDDHENYSEVVLQLDEFVGEDVYIAFRYEKPNGPWGDQWHIDDVMIVEADLSHDLACVKMNPIYHESLETPCNPEVTVKNFGYSIETSYDVHISIEGTDYDETITVNEDLAVMQENIIVCPDWIPEASGAYILTATVILSSDENADNNQFTFNTEAFSPEDYATNTVYSMEYAPSKDVVDMSISLNIETGEKIYLHDHDLVYPYRIGALTYMNGLIVGVQRDICDVFLMTPDGKFIRIGNIPNVFYINGIAYDEVSETLYAVGLEDDAIEDFMYTIDENWHVTELFPFQKPFIYGLAANLQGDLYGISTFDGSLFTIDLETQQTDEIGIIDGLHQALQIQDIGFDRTTNKLYGTLAISPGQILAQISTDDASLNILGNYGYDSPFGACAPIPAPSAELYNIVFHVHEAGDNINNALVHLSDGQSGNTNNEGDVSFYLDAGEITCTITADGYSEFEETYTISTNETIDIELLIDGVDEFSSYIKIYPNPSGGAFYLKNVKGFDVEITDISGKMVYQQKNLAETTYLNMNEKLNPGFYFIQLTLNEQVYREQIVIQ